jgi:acyl-CoA thioester hydrolase
MLERSDLEPLFFAPFVSSIMRVEPAWIDYNGHLNMAYYNVLFDRAVDEAYELLGIGLDYVKQRRHSVYTAEVHVRFLRELHAGDPVRATFQLIAYDSKRLHYFEQLVHATEGYLAATSENLAIHVDMDSSKSAPMSPRVVGRLEKMAASHARLPRPQAAGRSVGMKRD